jgi:TAT (twin-arginine translocation) pathway signal sequence
MSDLSRRDFLKFASAGSAAAAAAVGGGVLAKMKLLSSNASGGTVTFRAVRGVPGKPLPAYASFVLDGRVDLPTGTGTVTKTIYGGAPDAMSSIEFPELSRMFRVTSVEGDATNLRLQAVIDDRSTLRTGEPHTAMIVVDRRRGEVQAPFVDSDVVLALRGM